MKGGGEAEGTSCWELEGGHRCTSRALGSSSTGQESKAIGLCIGQWDSSPEKGLCFGL